MALRDWRARRVVAVCLAWPVSIAALLFIRGYRDAHRVRWESNVPMDVIATGLVPLSPRLWFGPPLVLLVTWWIARRSRPAG